MSRPRAATSVATRTRGWPTVKAPRARCRWFWFRLPWIAAAGTPAWVSCLASRAAPCLVRTKNSVRSGRWAISVAMATLSEAGSTNTRGSAAGPGSLAGAHPARPVTEGRQQVGDLLGEFPGGDQDEPTRGLLLPRAASAGEPGQHRQAEREGLAGPGLRAAEHVPAGQRVRQGPGLDGERRVDPALGERGDQRGGDAKLTEGGGGRRPCAKPPRQGPARGGTADRRAGR